MTDQYLTTTLNDLADHYDPETVLAEARRLFGPVTPSSPSRIDDPGTSHASGNRHATSDVGRFRSGTIKAELLMLYAQRPSTALAAAIEVGSSEGTMHTVETARKRVTELRQAGYIEDSGERRRNVGSPDESIVWRITRQGLLAVSDLRNTGWSRPRIRS